MDESRGFQGRLGRHGPDSRHFHNSGDGVFLIPFYSQKPLDFLNKVPNGTIGVEGSQLNLLVVIVCSLLCKLEVMQPEVAGLASRCLAKGLDAGVVVRQESGECRVTFG